MAEREPLLGAEQQTTADPEAAGHANRGKSSRSRRGRIATVLDSQAFHKTVIALITIDAACVIADLAYTFLSESCVPAEDNPAWLEVLAHISLTITTFFLIEIPLALTAFGARFYNPLGRVPHASLHLFDAGIIIITFMLEVVLKGRERELAGLLILLRLWRLVKLVGGIAVGAGEINEEISKELAEVRQLLAEHEQALARAMDENQKLKARLNTSIEGQDASQ